MIPRPDRSFGASSSLPPPPPDATAPWGRFSAHRAATGRGSVPRRPDLPPRRSRLVIAFFTSLVLLVVATVSFFVVREIRDHGEYAFLDRQDGVPLAWDPCTPIRYVVNEALAPEGTGEDLSEAIARLEEASGLDFVDAGRVDWTVEEYLGSGAAIRAADGGVTWAPVLIGWEDSASFRDEPNAYGGANVLPGTGAWRDRYVGGFVVMNADQSLPAGFDSDGSWGPAFQHELGHLVGLDHVESRREVMAPAHFPPWPTDYGEGDRRGLARLGRIACREGTPPPPVPFAGEAPLSDPVPVR
ncbi:MAG: hypothetical protein WEA54_04885 [Actinomycetota bacterium]